SGNQVAHDASISFDVTAPEVSAIRLDDALLVDGRELLGSVDGYRPSVEADAHDAHSGVAGVRLLLDGAVVADGASWHAGDDLAPGEHELVVRVTDVAGNVATRTRSFVVVDDVAPVIDVSSPSSAGDADPVLDASAT